MITSDVRTFNLTIVNHCLVMIEEDRMRGATQETEVGFAIMASVGFYLQYGAEVWRQHRKRYMDGGMFAPTLWFFNHME